MTEDQIQRLFGTQSDGVLYVPESVMKLCKLRPGDKLRIIPGKDGFKVQLEEPQPGGQP